MEDFLGLKHLSSEIESSPRSLPLILAGPILRRVDKRQVCIWTAWSRPANLGAKIFRAHELKKESPIILGKGSSSTLQLGKNLHIALTIARPLTFGSSTDLDQTHTFPTGELLAYDINVTITDMTNRTKGEHLGFKELGLLEGRNSIVYENLIGEAPLPTFFIPEEMDPVLNVMHGSCRKLHGGGQDSLVSLDEVIASNVAMLRKRPSALFLTGDQIYADDVAGPLSRHLTELGTSLIGFEERFQGIGKRLTEMQLGERQNIIEKYVGFTSPNGGNHLFSFGEFAAMYLAAWNAEMWPDKFPNSEQIFSDKIKEKNAKSFKKKYDAEIRRLESTRRDIPAIRRAMANIPVYMICDDHEVTDDWNITREWVNNVKKSRLGSKIVTNALAAYWAFQAWGNDPESFTENFILEITKYVCQKTTMADNNELSAQNHLLNFHSWTFSCQTKPVTIFLDCRTNRKYSNLNGPPELVNEEELESLLKAANNSGYVKGEPVIIVVPTPVFGFDWIERIQRIIARVFDIYKADLEVWSANKKGLARFLTFVSENLNPSLCILFSGDVHYGFTKSGNFSFRSIDSSVTTMKVIQLTSSALKTTSLSKRVIIGAMIGHLREFFSPKTSIRNGKLSHKVLNGQPPHAPHDWLASSSIVRMGGSSFPSLLITDNNIGLASVDIKRGIVLHDLLVRNGDGRIDNNEVNVELGELSPSCDTKLQTSEAN